MKNARTRSLILVTLSTIGLGGAGCGSSTPAKTGTAGSGAGAAGTAGTAGATGSGGAPFITDAGAAACPKSALTILFNPMYSAYDGVHMFQLPAVVNGIDPTAVDIQWSASDPSMVALETDPTTGGVMITMQKAGNVDIIASAGSLCGIAHLSITAATPDDWQAGSDRYNNGVVLNRLPIGGGRMQPDAGADGGIQAKCTDCHGDTAASGPFKTVQHTPEQTGGFSDADLINIFEHGMVPQGGYFDTSIVSYMVWQAFHKWDVGDSEKGLVIYLRSLTPAAQTGAANFGGRFDGGVRRDGGFMRPEGGMGMGRRDAAAGQ
jgi:hypothetical protein